MKFNRDVFSIKNILPGLKNKYVIIFIIFLVYMLFFDTYSYLDNRELSSTISELENNRDYYKNEISLDNKKIKLLQNPNQIEKFAREQYYMKKDSEDIYIIEFEGDSLKNEIKNN